ncbi:MAG TPA: hypothetical protein PKY12_10720 [Catalimonadaceae bacterium]|nr:hypothetical protein [Catalimonadaceae bacterium]
MRIVLAQILKPSSETRIFEKLGITLAENAFLDIQIWGSDLFTSNPSTYLPNIRALPVFSQKKGLSNRIRNLGQFWNLLQKSEPDVIICSSPDLVLIALIYRLFRFSFIILDLQENHSLNFKFQSVYNKWNFRLTRGLISFVQKWILKKVDQIWIAEEIYYQQLIAPIKISNWNLFENKVPVHWETSPISENRLPQLPYFLFSGVITTESGIERAILWMEYWTKTHPDWTLKVCGYCPDPVLTQRLFKIQAVKPWLILMDIENWKTSNEIRNELIGCEAVLMPYYESFANLGKKPTKWFEARWAGKPALIQKNGQWKKLEGTIEVDFNSPEFCNPEMTLLEMRSFSNTNSNSSDWLFEREKLKSEFQEILNRLKKGNNNI